MTEHDKLLNRRLINQESHNRNLDHTIKSLQDEIQLTIYNYENILQTEKKNSSERSDFLLYLIQSLRTRHLEELQAMTVQIQNAQAQRESVQSMQKQMENIGDGLDQIMEESHKLKAQNESLTKQLEEEENKQKQLDEELDICHRQLQDCRLKVDDWERMKIKWNRHKKELIEMIEDAQKAAAEGQLQSEENQEYQKIICAHSGLDQNICDHCQKHRIEELRQKYSNEFRKST